MKTADGSGAAGGSGATGGSGARGGGAGAGGGGAADDRDGSGKSRGGPFRAPGSILALASLTAILLLTLRPASETHFLGQSFVCILCGRYGLSNLLRNIVLFVPLGIGLGLVLRSRWQAWALTVLLTLVIEVTQIFIPGRNPLLVDLLTNAAGGGMGVALAVALRARAAPSTPAPSTRMPPTRMPPTPGLGGRTRHRRLVGLHAFLWTGVSAAVLAGTAFAFRLAPPDAPHHVQWTPRLGHLGAYGGTLHEARLGDEPLPPGRHADPAWLERGLLGQAPLFLDVTPGPPPPRLAPIFSVYTAEREELFLLGADGTDLVLRLPYNAARMRLDHPDLRRRGVFAAAAQEAGAGPIRVRARLTDVGACLSITGAGERCGLRPTMGEGWTLLLFPGFLPPWARRAMNLAWMVALGLLPTFFIRSGWGAAAVGAGLTGVAAATPSLAGSFAWLPPWEGGALLTGALLGWAAGRQLQQIGGGRSPATAVAAPQHHPAGPDRGGKIPGRATRRPPSSSRGM